MNMTILTFVQCALIRGSISTGGNTQIHQSRDLAFYNGTELVAGLSMFADSCASGASHTDLNHRRQRQSRHVLALN